MEEFNINDLIYSDFADAIIVHRVKEAIYMCRENIDNLDMRDRTTGLNEPQREDLDQNWTDMEGLIVVYQFFTGDYELNGIKEWA